MKTLTLFFLVLFATLLTANAQITKGNWMVGGTGNFYSAQLKNDNMTSNGIGLELRPNLGYFITDKFAMGMSPLFAYYKPENGISVISYGIGPYIRYYFLKPENRINVLSHVGYSYFGDNRANDKSTALDFRAGPVVFFNSSVALEMTLNYNLNKLDSSTNYNIFSLGLGFQIHLEK
ncbi:outer membrane beta-barrel protein [Mariniflexile sp.]|uniref:outer membrane beta-barrel protein n=1 Tax=Mariniflexile sp. TaxID=1979402 RepID=UPI004047EB1A